MTTIRVGLLAAETIFIRTIRDHLARNGVSVEPIPDIHAISDPGATPPDLFLLDTAFIPETASHLETDIPVIVMEMEGGTPVSSNGLIQSIRKPFEPEALLEQIHRILRKRKVLIVDDSDHFRQMVAAEFPEDRFEVAFAVNGLEGYRQARSFQPDLITMDVEMPEMDGYKACEMIRNDPVTENIPIIFVTTLGREDDIERGFRAGAVEYFVKPFEPGTLARFVRRLLVRIESRRTVPLAVLDRSKTSAKLVEYLLMKHGFAVHTCATLDELIQQLPSQRPTLAIINMEAVTDAPEAAIQRFIHHHPDVPVIAVTSGNRKAPVLRALTAGAADYVQAPFLEEELLLRVEHQLGLRRALMQLDAANRKLRELSVHDPLTGLYNRGYFNTALMGEIKKLSRQKSWLSCILLDIDHFKHINDQFGHLTGDAILVQLARLLKEIPRETDIVARYGGEEFVLLLPQTDPAGAVQLAEKIRTAVAERPFQHQDLTVPVSISLGVHGIQNFLEGRNLLQYADEALYQAKESGRNRTVCHATDTT